ncbi:MAG: hypothetical protein M1508_00430 [Nitrospirae bacterium]|nr:hypothetical protein [Nitrospirota bacterium]MCL5422485.1 hypothetical protein [Nitrospirota bacterium]
MTKVVVHSGVCGFSVTVTAEKGKDKKILISLETECEMVEKMAEEISVMDMMAVFTRFLDNPVYRSASKHLKHVTCPVPGGILKAMEAEAGFALPKDVSIIFLKDEKSPGESKK